VVTQKFILRLLIVAIFLPIALSVGWGVSELLGAMSDDTAARVVQRIALAGAVIWVIVLIILVLTLAVKAAVSDTTSDDSADS